MKLFRIIRTASVFRNSISISVALPEDIKNIKLNQFKTEDNLLYTEDPDNFGTLSPISNNREAIEDEDDIKEENFLQNKPLSFQKLTTKQYADLIKQYIKHKRLKEAIDVLEVKMLKEDRVKPENYIYNILIGACADVGYTKKAFKLYNDMKRRSLLPTGDTYTCLFSACSNSPWPQDGLKNALHLKELMVEKGIEPNLTNYNAMIKAFGRCGDLETAFSIVDEMMQKKIKIRVHTFNHLLHACISDKGNGLRHALIVWRKMLKMREKPNIYSFNLMLKCVKDCNLGNKNDIIELISIIQSLMPQGVKNNRQLEFVQYDNVQKLEQDNKLLLEPSKKHFNNTSAKSQTEIVGSEPNEVTVIENRNDIIIELVDKLDRVKPDDRTVPNLLSKNLNMDQVTALQQVDTVQEKFAIIGGQEDFFKEMEVYSVKPNIKTFTQILPLLDNNIEAESKLLDMMKSLDVKADIDFYNMLIKRRCLRLDDNAAIAVKDIIKKESEYRKKRYPHAKKLKLKVNIMTYGVLAMACRTKESAEELLKEMAEKKIKVNIEILGTLLKQGTVNYQFGYVVYIMNMMKIENIQPNDVFLKHLESFHNRCQKQESESFKKSYEQFSKFYINWLKDIDITEVLKSEHPWQQFRENYPNTIQRDQVVIKQPKRFYKKNRKYVPYTPKL